VWWAWSSRTAHHKMVQNLFWAAGCNVVALPLTAGVLALVEFVLSRAVGALLMSLRMVYVADGAQLLRRVEIGPNPANSSMVSKGSQRE
jgi:cation transport ATPase